MPADVPIAIIGSAYRAPGIGRKGLWEFLSEARSAWSAVPSDRFQQSAVHHAASSSLKPGLFSGAGAHFLPDDIYAFDPAFFNLTADEARAMDPQHRVLMECALEACESAGLSLRSIANTQTGVFAALAQPEYGYQAFEDLPTTTKFTATGIAMTMFANRLSYWFGLRGPSISVDAACASSSYALHLACQSIRSGECSSAFVGGCALIVSPATWATLDLIGALSPEGRCYSYDSRASGFGRGEGAGCVILKRLDDALADGDPIRAVIRNTVAGHSGRTDGISMPSATAQADLLRQVHDEIGLLPADTDPIEASAIAAIIGKDRTPENPVFMGSVKSNFGHLEGASGILATIKAMMMVENGQILPNAGNGNMNGNGHINGYGNGHLNGHVNGHDNHDSRGHRIYAFSAKSDISLSTYLSSFSQWLDEASDTPEFLDDLAYTLGPRRSHFAYRFAAVADSVSSLQDQIRSFSKSTRSRPPVVAFVFTGQGAQYAGMATELQCYKPFRDTIDEVEDHLRKLGATWSLKDELSQTGPDSRINDVEISQPACTAVQIALVRQLEAWGIRPSIVTGHSSGEIASAYAAGVLSLEAAVAIAFYRGLAARQVFDDDKLKGSMLAVGVGADQAEALIQQHESSGYATLAAINSPASVTISGDEDAIGAIQRAAEAQGAFVRRLKTGVAYHSRHMEKVASTYLAAIKPWCKDIGLDSDIRYISSVTRRAETAKSLGASYWVMNLLQPVRFMDAVEAVASGKDTAPSVILEIGPHSSLGNPIKQILENLRSQQEKAQAQNIAYLPTLVRGKAADQALLTSAASMYSLGATLNFPGINQVSGGTPGQVLTDLPAYEWNKTARYIHQRRITQQKQQPGHAYHPLLGWKSPYSEGRDYSFRQIISLDEMPWIRDHNIANSIMFPMTGYICMAAAALKAIRSLPSCAVVVRDFHAKRGLSIQEDERVELITKLSPAATGTEFFSQTSWAVEISSWTEARGWTTHCYGTIEQDTNEDITQSPSLSSRSALATSPRLRARDASGEYALLARNGMRYEGIFKTMDKLSTAPGLTVMETQARRLHSSYTDSTTAIDPPMLDAFLHGAAITVEVPGEENIRHTYMPVSFSRLRLPASLPACDDHRFTTIMELLDRDEKSGDFRTRLSIFRHDDQDGRLQPVVEWDNVLCKAVSRHETKASSLGPVPNSYHVQHVPHVKFWDPAEVQRRIAVELVPEEEIQIARRSDQVARYFMSRALGHMATTEDLTTSLPSHLVKCTNWFRRAVAAGQAVPSEHEAAELIATLSNSGAQGEMLCLVGQHLPAILRNEMQPLELMLRDGLLSRNYEEDRWLRRTNTVLGNYVRHLVEANPFLRVLEIGAGTGSSTKAIFEALSQGGAGPAVYEHVDYTFTDISAGFFEGGRAKLSPWAEQITYKQLDITRDPSAEQGFVAESYDLIVASNVLHATPKIQETLRHARSLLRTGGQMALVEFTANMPYHLPWTSLPGWWVAEDDYRSDDGPLLSETSWDRVLRDTGFAGTDMVAHVDSDVVGVPLGLITSTRIDKAASCAETTNETSQRVIIWGDFTDNVTADFAQSLAGQLSQHHNYDCVVQKIESCDKETLNRQDWSIVIDDPTRSILGDMTGPKFEHIHNLLSQTGGLLWVMPRGHTPESAIAQGLLRPLRQEDPSRSFLLFQDVPLDENGMTKIGQLLPELDNSNTAAQRRDQEFALNEATNDIEVPRVRMIEDAKTPFLCDAGVPPRSERELWEAAGDDALEMTIDAAGSPDSMFFRRSDVLRTPPGPDEVIVRVDAAGVNFRDLLQVLGTIPWKGLGFEGAGVVSHVGSGVANVAVGDHVFFMSAAGAFATHVRIPSLWVCKIPDGTFSSSEAASIPLAYCTAIMALRRNSNIQKGESVLIHSASGAVGQACIAVAQAAGAEVFVTNHSPEKREFMHKTLGVPETHILSSQTSDFRDRILALTGGRGVDVVVNSLSGPLLQESWSLIAEFGRFVELGRKDFLENSHLAMKPFDRNVTFSGIDLQKYFTQRPEAVAECFAQLIDGWGSVVRPIRPVNEVPVSKIATALRKLQSGVNVGKQVVTIGQHDRVMAERVSPLGGPSARLLKTDATYLITGGTGGIGRSLARWMFAQGAGNVVLLGRSGSSRPEVAQLVEEFGGKSGRTLRAISCDVGSRDDLQAALDSILDLPPVRGIVHGALYLHDAFFANATHDDWEKITGPKISAAWNLHHLCPDLDFFVSLGSIAGILGDVGQSVYAGTSTFLDAFTDYRVARGLPATYISLPIVLDIGYAADKGIDKELGESTGMTLTEAQLHTTVKAAIVGVSSGMLPRGKGLTFAQSEAALQQPSLNLPLAMAALRSRDRQSSSSKASTGVELGGVRDLPTLLDALVRKVASMTLMEYEEVEADQPLATYGLDSLVLVELRNWIRRETDVDISVARIGEAENLEALAEMMLK
ncbi:Type I Iterative PKS [Diaporthe eres]